VLLFCERVNSWGERERRRKFVALAVTFTTRRPKVLLPSIRPGPAAPRRLLQLSRREYDKKGKKGEKIRVKRHSTIGQQHYIYIYIYSIVV
jgi:hypothetical protein